MKCIILYMENGIDAVLKLGKSVEKKCLKFMRRNLATWGPDVPDDSVPDKRFLAEVNREVCRRRLMHHPIKI